MIDAHCHIDLYDEPLKMAAECEQNGITAICMTNLPSHFELGVDHIARFKRVRLALGLHPLYAEQGEKEMDVFLRNISRTSYIGEIGLDYSREGIPTKAIQLRVFEKILDHLSSERKMISLHSRKAEKEVLDLLKSKKIRSAIFHWYSGPLLLISDIFEAGHYFSVNPAMIRSNTGRSIIGRIPLTNLLAESDGPFIDMGGRPSVPEDVGLVYTYLAELYGLHAEEISRQISYNFKKIIGIIR